MLRLQQLGDEVVLRCGLALGDRTPVVDGGAAAGVAGVIAAPSITRGADAPDNETARGIIDKLFFSDKRYDLGEVGRYKINRRLNLNFPIEKKVLTKDDIIAIIKIKVTCRNYIYCCLKKIK